MIHILQSVSNMDRGGIESMLMNYYRHLDRTRSSSIFWSTRKSPAFLMTRSAHWAGASSRARA